MAILSFMVPLLEKLSVPDIAPLFIFEIIYSHSNSTISATNI